MTKEAARFIPIAPYGGTPQPKNSVKKEKHRACDLCRRMKTKCQSVDGFRNCRRCISTNKECTYNMGLKKRGPRQGYIGALEDRLKRIEGLLTGISQESADPKKTSDNSDLSSSGNTERVEIKKEMSPDQIKEEDSTDLTSYYRQFTFDGRYIRENDLMKGILEGECGLEYRKDVQSRYGIDIQYNEKSNLYKIRRIATSEDTRNQQINELIEVGLISPHETIGNINQWIYRVSGIDRVLSDRLLKIYFAYIHPLLPVINKTEFLEEYRGIRSTFPAGYLLNAIYGAAVRYVENCKKFNDLDSIDDGGAWDFPEGFSERLFDSIMLFIKGKYVLRISTIQSIIITHNHSANVNNWTSGWLLNCTAVRMCQELGLHRSTNGWNISEQEKETRKMVWWSAYVLDRWFSAGSGRPLNIFDEDCDTEYPSASVSVDEVMDTMTENDQHFPRFPSVNQAIANSVNEIPLNEPFIQLLKLSEILGFVLQNLYTPKAKKHSARYGSDSIVAYVNESLYKWRSALPPLFEISKAGEKTVRNKDHNPLVSVSGLICLSYCTILILLHRPFIESSTDEKKKDEASSQSSLAICTSAAIRIIEVAEGMHYRDFLLISWGFALYPIFTAALIHIYNCSNSNPSVSEIAKSNLMRAFTVMGRICVLSPIATDMGLVLKEVICDSPIFVNDPEFVFKIKNRKADPFASYYITMDNETFKKQYEATTNGQKDDGTPIDQLYTRDHIATLLTKSLMGACKDDVTKQKHLASELTLQVPFYHEQQTNIQTNNVPSTASNSHGQHCYDIPTIPPSSHSPNTDPLHYISNYGLLSSAPIDQVNNSEIPNTIVTNFFAPQITVPGLNYNEYTAASPSNGYIQQDPSVVFRHSPGNPFWSIPTSMELDEWAAYLLPHQQERQL